VRSIDDSNDVRVVDEVAVTIAATRHSARRGQREGDRRGIGECVLRAVHDGSHGVRSGGEVHSGCRGEDPGRHRREISGGLAARVGRTRDEAEGELHCCVRAGKRSQADEREEDHRNALRHSTSEGVRHEEDNGGGDR
jgi:hypothetical protein